MAEQQTLEMIGNALNESPNSVKSPASQSHIDVFKPRNQLAHDDNIENLTSKQLEELTWKNAEAKLRPKFTRVVATLIIAITSVGLIAWTNVDFHPTKALAVALIIMFLIYFAHVFYLIGYSETAYRIYSLTSTVDRWSRMPITYRALQYKKDSIGSISEFSAIGGGIANQMLLAIGILTSTAVCVQEVNNVWFEKIWLSFTNNLLCNSCNQKVVVVFDGAYIDVFFIFFGAFGLTLLGIFELDPFSWWLPKLHYFGGLLGVGTVVGFDIQQYYTYRKHNKAPDETELNSFGLFWCAIFSVTAIIAFPLWTIYFSKKADNFSKVLKDPENPNPDNLSDEEIDKQVRRNSIYCVVSESVFLMSGAFALCCWLWFFNDLNPSFKGTAGGMLPTGGPWKLYYDYIIEKYECNADIPIDQLC